MNAFALAVSVACALFGQVAPDEPTNGDRVDTESAERLAFMSESVTDYEIQTMAESPLAAVLRPDPILRWNNPVSGVRDGIVAMWTIDGRPAVLAQVFVTRDEIWLHEFQTVAEGPLELSKGDATVWTPAAAGLEMHLVPDAPDPAGTPVARLVQMRNLVQRFSATSLFRIDSTDPDVSPYDLRLMSRPLYRYGDDQTDIADGALFAFAQGTNPEVWLMLEARQTDDGLKWHYGLAPMTGYGIRARLDGGLVLDVPERQRDRGPESTYFITRFLEE